MRTGVLTLFSEEFDKVSLAAELRTDFIDVMLLSIVVGGNLH
jgi:hypothetical protein